MDFNILNYGAAAGGEALNTNAIQAAIDACNQAGGGRVVVPNGTFLTGGIWLKSGVDLHLESGAVLLGSPNVCDYPNRENLKHVNTQMLPRFSSACLIFAEEAENISLSGMGTIDCNGKCFVEPHDDEKEGWRLGWGFHRIYGLNTPPRVVFFAGCKNVRVQDLTMVNQPAGWSYWIHDCDFVTFDRVKIDCDVQYPNNDGIHINSSRNVTISNCSITCGDDCIIVRANNSSLAENKVCEKVVVTNCNLTSYSAAIRIGWTNDGIIRNCTFSNIVMTDCSRGISMVLPYLKRVQADPATADVGREATLVENLSFSNIIMHGTNSNPIAIELNESEDVMCRGIQNIYFDNVHASSPEFPIIKGRPSCRFKNIWFTNCSFEVTDGSEFPDRWHHGAFNLPDTNYHPMTLRCVDNVQFNNTTFSISR